MDAPASSWIPIGPFGGDVYAVSFDPRDSAVAYASSGDGAWGGAGVLKSTDHGASWHLSRNGLPKDMGVLSLAIDPSDPDTLYAGATLSEGIYRSRDAGGTWRPMTTGVYPPPFRVWALEPLPWSPGVVLAGTALGIYRSADYGDTWVHVPTPGKFLPEVLSLSSDRIRVVYAVSSRLGVFRSSDGGLTWESLQGAVGRDGQTIRVDPNDPETVYVLTSGTIRRSQDGGETWGPLHYFGGAYVDGLLIDEHRPGTIYVGSEGKIFKSSDGGGTWSTYEQGLALYTFPGNKITQLVADPNAPDTLFACGRRGLYVSTDAGQSWVHTDQGIPGMDIRALSVGRDADGAAAIYALEHTWGPFKSTDGGVSWRQLFPNIYDDKDVRTILAPQSRPGAVFVGFRKYVGPRTVLIISESRDGGQTWTRRFRRATKRSSFTFIVGDERSADAVYLGIDNNEFDGPKRVHGIFRSRTGAPGWERIDSFPEEDRPLSLAIHPRNSNILYAGGYDGIYCSRDGGAIWRLSLIGDGYKPEFRSVVIDRANPDIVYAAGYQQGLFKSTNGGRDWTRINSGLPDGRGVRALAIDPTDNRIVYASVVGTDLFVSPDGGESWERLRGAIPSARIVGLAVDPTEPGRLYAASDTSGVFMSAPDPR